MSGMKIGKVSRIPRLSLMFFILFLGFLRPACCANGDDDDEDAPNKHLAGRSLVTALIYSQISNLTKIFHADITRTLGYCVKDVDSDLNGAFKFNNNLDFLDNCVKQTKDVTQRICTAAEMKFYFSGFMDQKSGEAQILKPNRNCNLTSWIPGCEPGWASSVPSNIKVEIRNSQIIPQRTHDSQPCCEGFFCPRGLTCMIPCPLGAYCPLAKLNKTTGTCDPYLYQLPPGKVNHTCGGADVWASVTSSEEIFCSAGSFCPTTTTKVPCTQGHYCRMGFTAEKACFKLSTCNSRTAEQNLHAFGFLLIGALTFILSVIYNCSDQVISTRYKRLAMSREAAARSARETAQARERWKSAKNVAKKGASGLQQQLSRTFSRKTSKKAEVLPPKAPAIQSSGVTKVKKKEPGNLTKMLQNLENDSESSEGFHMEIGDRNLKKQAPKSKQLHTKSQIFKYAYGQLEKEKAMEQNNQNLTFSGVISMARDTEVRTRMTIEVSFKDLTLTLKGKHKHLMRSVTGKLFPGRISAVMGPSGAGKTTFLSSVLGKTTGCTMTGSILINGRPDPIQSYKKIVGFVPQDDIVHGNLTVEENLRFSARCRLAEDLPKADKVLVVERVIESLGLQGVRESLVGTVQKRGISGGQRKRVNVGIEMVMEPSLLILDEPTSGLDSSSSNLLLKALRREALEGVNICMVVHQPSYTLYKMFDDLILLAKGGLTVYHGPVKKVEEYFAGVGINVPERVNPPDHLIDILEGIVKPGGGLSVEQLPVRWMLHNGYPVPHDMMQLLDQIGSSSKEVNPSVDDSHPLVGEPWKEKQQSMNHLLNPRDLSNRVTPGVLRQYRYYLGRVSKQLLREAKLQAVDYLILLLAGACLGSLSKVKGDTFGYRGYMYTIIAMSLLCKVAALRSFSLDKLEYWRERSSGISSLAYFLSKDTVDLFNTVVKPLVFLSMFYFLNTPRSTFADNYIILLCLVYCVTGIAYVFAIILEPGPAQLWCVLLPVVLTLIATMDPEARMAKVLANYCYPKWALEAFVIANAQRYSGVWLITRCGTLLELGFSVHNYAGCLVSLISTGVAFRFLAFLLVQKMKSCTRTVIFSGFALSRSLNPNLSPHRFPLPLVPLSSHRILSSRSGKNTGVVRLASIRCSSSDSISSLTMTPGGEVETGVPSSPITQNMEKQFEDFRRHLDDSGNLRERIRAVAVEIESVIRLMHGSLLLVHQSGPASGVLEKAKGKIVVLKELFGKLAEILRECSGQYYRYHGDWRSETQSAVSLLAFIHLLETGTLLLHTEAEEKLGLNSSDFGLDIEDYLIGICFLSNELPRYVVNRVTAGDYDCPRNILNFLTDLHTSFRMLNLRNDFLRKKFDSMKYDLRKVEDVYYDVKIRGLGTIDSKEQL